MYKLKTFPEDFIVEEIPDLTLDDSGTYTYFELKKSNFTTLNAIKRISERSKIDFKNFSFAGTKDKLAETTQTISIRSRIGKKIDDIHIPEINIRFIGFGKEPISLGDLKGNKFTITIRNLKDAPEDIENKRQFINYFGDQRFSENNVDIGRLIIRNNLKDAVNLIIKTDKQYQNQLLNQLMTSPNDFVGALKKIPKKILTMYIHSLQSSIWNKTASELKRRETRQNLKIPIVGFGTELEGELKDIIEPILKEENLTPRDFIIRNMPDLSSEGDTREFLKEARDLRIIEISKDEMNNNRRKMIISFTLDKGCYATEFIKQLFF